MAATQDTNENKKKTVFLEEALEIVGEGLYTNYLCFVSGMATLAGISTMQSMLFILPTVGCELNLSSVETAFLGSLTFIGSIISANFIGFLVDKYGRRKLLIISMFGIFISSILASLSPNVITLMIVTFCSGILCGGVFGLPYVYLSEFCRMEIRAKYVTLSSLIAILSNVYSPSVAWIVMWLDIFIPIVGNFNFTSWRLYIILNSLPVLISALLLLKLPESPKFLLNKGKASEALLVLKTTYSVNYKRPLEEFPVEKLQLDSEDDVQQSSNKTQCEFLNFIITLFLQIRDLFIPPFLIYTFICSALMFAVVGLYGVIFMWLPVEASKIIYYESTHGQYDLTVCALMSDKNENQRNSSCHVDNDTFLTSFIVGMAFFGLTVVMVFLVRKFNVKYILGMNILIVSALCATVTFSNSAILTLASLGGSVALLGASQALVYGIIVNFFPTPMRATASSVAMVFGRVTVAIGSLAVGATFKTHCTIAYLVMSASFAVVSVLCFITPLKKKKSLGSVE